MVQRHRLRLWQLVLGLLLSALSASAAPTRNQAAYWRHHYGEAPSDDICVQKVT